MHCDSIKALHHSLSSFRENEKKSNLYILWFSDIMKCVKNGIQRKSYRVAPHSVHICNFLLYNLFRALIFCRSQMFLRNTTTIPMLAYSLLRPAGSCLQIWFSFGSFTAGMMIKKWTVPKTKIYRRTLHNYVLCCKNYAYNAEGVVMGKFCIKSHLCALGYTYITSSSEIAP